ncbi:MAG TPA: nitroreductase family deazaflavin-dependent oxidoreductase, partial [Actinomycetota bacterium]|nr:nitroreductase family deazaflavin-dependent oxidoreductase [Actinomycetota bacterium]
MPLSRGFARFNRRVANPVVRRVAGRVPPLAIVDHRGRRTGRDYSTPVIAVRSGVDVVIGAVYGVESDWVRNVMAAGHARVEQRGRTREYVRPRLIGTDEDSARCRPSSGSRSGRSGSA